MLLQKPIIAAVKAIAAGLAIVAHEHRRAHDAELLHDHLKHGSDADLARQGARRESIAEIVKKRLY